MPKIIDDLQSALIREARAMLLEDGGKGLTIRHVAGRCHVAVGTVYNYFRSKDELTAYVMLEDWQKALCAMRAAAENAPEVMSGLRGVHGALRDFIGLYQPAWQTYAASNDASASIRKRHGMLIAQLTEVIAPLLARHGVSWNDYLPAFLSETLLTAASRGEESFELVCPILERLIHA